MDPVLRGLAWAALAGILFVLLNTLTRVMTLQLHPLQAQFLRYAFSVVAMLPLVWRFGMADFMPQRMGGQFLRGAVHTVGLMVWFMALPQVSMATTTAIGFTTPIFVMLGAALFLSEAMRWDRWVAAGIGFVGVMVVVLPSLDTQGGVYNLLMLSTGPLFAASFLLTKALTRHERAGVIVLWQAISISLLSLPTAWWFWSTPTAWQWLGFLGTGVLGVLAHYALTHAFSIADISSTQSIRFLDLVWASLLGWLVFAEVPGQATLVGGAVICAATVWIALRESRARR